MVRQGKVPSFTHQLYTSNPSVVPASGIMTHAEKTCAEYTSDAGSRPAICTRLCVSTAIAITIVCPACAETRKGAMAARRQVNPSAAVPSTGAQQSHKRQKQSTSAALLDMGFLSPNPRLSPRGR